MDDCIAKNDLHKKVCKNIKKYRLQANITQEELSERIGISHDYLRRLESDKGQKDFTFYTLYKISLVLGVALNDFILDEN